MSNAQVGGFPERLLQSLPTLLGREHEQNIVSVHLIRQYITNGEISVKMLFIKKL